METSDFLVLSQLLAWLREGKKVTLCTVLNTWGGAPRQPGAIAAISEDGQISGSVSGGCVEDDLVEYLSKNKQKKFAVKIYGDDEKQFSRLRLPCGSKLEILLEPAQDQEQLLQIISFIKERKTIQRVFDLDSGSSSVIPAEHNMLFRYDGRYVSNVFGPLWQLIIVGAGDISRFVSRMALMIDFKVIVCDPREEYFAGWDVDDTEFDTRMPDDVVLTRAIDNRTAVVALTHDQKLDDMALMAALKSSAYYVGALGSRKTNKNRRERLKQVGITDKEIACMHGPVGVPIGSRTPAEIAISILADLIKTRQEQLNN